MRSTLLIRTFRKWVLCAGCTLSAAIVLFWLRARAPQRSSNNSAALKVQFQSPEELHTDREPLAESAQADKREREIKTAIAYWANHRNRVKEIVEIELPAALARRNEAEPCFHDIVDYGLGYGLQFWKENAEKIKRLNKLLESTPQPGHDFQDLERLEENLAYIRTFENSTTVAGSESVADIARKNLESNDPQNYLRSGVAQLERQVLGDHAAALQVEACQTPQEVVEYLQGAAARYEKAAQSIIDRLPLDQPTRDFLPALADANGRLRFGIAYKLRANREISPLLDEYYDTRRALQYTLGNSTEDSAESRSINTELSDLVTQVAKIEGK